MTSGYVAATAFLIFTGIGSLAQVRKLATRTREWRSGTLAQSEVCAGLHPVREMWSYTAFLLFALSGVTRSYLDYFLITSRVPIIALSTVTLWYLQFHGEKGARKYYLFALAGNLVLGGMLAAVLAGVEVSRAELMLAVDVSVAMVSALLFYGKALQAYTMYRDERTGAVSWLRESGVVVKDLTGLWYAWTVGSELLWVGVTHTLSGLSSGSICLAKLLVERRRPVQS